MKYFKDTKTNDVFAYDSRDQSDLIKTAITMGFIEVKQWPPKPTLANIKQQHALAINADYQTALDAGVTYKTALFQSDAKSISTLTEALTAIASGWPLPAGFAWIDAANTPHPASVAFLKGLSTAMANHKAALFTRLQIAKQGIAAGKTEAALNKIVF